jgi:hypothetical protein
MYCVGVEAIGVADTILFPRNEGWVIDRVVFIALGGLGTHFRFSAFVNGDKRGILAR